MENEKKEVVEVEENEDEVIEDELDEETTDWKAEAIKARGIAKRNATRLEKLKQAQASMKVETPAEVKKEAKKEGFDYAEKAYLKSSGINPNEFDLVQEAMRGTGKSLEDVLENKYFQAELKDKREAEASKAAIPSGTKRSSSSGSSSVEYWLNRDELPKDNPKLAREVLEAKIKREKSGFSNFN